MWPLGFLSQPISVFRSLILRRPRSRSREKGKTIDLGRLRIRLRLSCTTSARAITSQTDGTILTLDFREICEVSLFVGFLFFH